MVGKGMGESLTKVKVSGTDPDGDSAGNTASITLAELSERYLDKGHNPRDSDNFCHYEWWSCTENQISLGNRDDKLSVFTKHMVNGLRSGHKCGLQDTTDQCMLCKRLQKEALAKGYISPEILNSYVFEHVKKELANYRIQQPMNTRSEKRPMKIAYYNKRHLCQEVVVFTPKETLVIKLTDQVEAKLSDIKDYIAGEVKEKGLFPSSVTGDQLCLMEEALHKEIDDDKELQQSLDRNFPLHCCLRTAQTYFKLLSGPIVLLPIDREKLMELLDHLVIETTGKEGLLFKAVKVMNRHYTITFCAEKYEGNPIKIPSQYQQDEVVKEYIGTINYAINSIHDLDQDEMRVVKSGVTFHVKIVMDKCGNTPEELDWAEIVMVYCSYL
ncbi:uncharacterized protein LOC106172620 [Lingula anatina]|uniref:Uncharacterized protein LOC106172620 n=1 Tax=Lingula anatina TaxID=7574 RepID=A0A1S3JEM3_LINAN|nr:uncharacterized protein LOC106172620 [Lingula anatina]|eukprot:XP_013408862.1 uncharacterized protein LOC106172620 [Lingula anatina]